MIKSFTLITNLCHDRAEGTLWCNGRRICYTIERPWVSNQKNVSCIPDGVYRLTHYDSPSQGRKVLALENQALGVTLHGPSQRTHILIHPANRVDQLLGCIAPGLKLTVNGVERSTAALERIMELLDGEDGTLRIVRRP